METQEMPESLVNLSDIQEIEEIQEDIVSIPKEVILISLVSQEQALYNPKHEHYRNTQRKDIKWLDIAENVGWSETQCKAKWKAMRDQYCRELKRSKFNAKANVKWKYFKELDFLRPYALSRNYRPRNSIVNANNSNNNTTNINNNHTNSNNNNHNNNNLTIHQNQTETTAPALINNISHNAQDDADDHEFPSIKIEAGQFNASDFVSEAGTTTTTTHIKNDHRLLASLTPEQLNIIQQQQDGSNWNYITTTTTATTTAAAAAALALSRTTEILIKTDSQSNGIGGSNGNSHNSNNNNNNNNSNNLINGNNLQTIVTAVTNASDEALYNSFVAQITQQQQQQQQQQHVSASTSANQLHLQQQQQQHLTPDEEDEDPIHTFLNIESYFEKELIAMIQQEDILYNNYHPNYRNVKMKLEVWDEIARKLKKTVKQCRLKWKALRDQYIREHKRLKNRENPETLPRWKHYDALSFLQKFIKHKSGETEKNLIEIPKTEIDIEMEEPCLQSPKLSPIHVSSDLHTNAHHHHPQQQSQQSAHLQHLQQTLPSLSGPHNLNNNNNSSSNQQVQTSLQQQQQHHTLQQSSVHLQQHQHQQLLHSRHHHQQQHQHQQIHHHHDSAEDESLCAVTCGDVTSYDEMDINDYIIGDGDDDRNEVDRGGGDGGDVAVVVNAAAIDDDQELDDDDEDGNEGEEDGVEDEEEGERNAEEGDIDHKSQHFPPAYSPHVNSVGNSNDIDEEMPQHRLEFKSSHDGSLSQAQTPNSHSFSQQALVLQQHYQQQQQQQQNHERDFRDHLQTSLLNGSITTSTTTTSATSIGNETLHAAALSLGLGASISVNQVAHAAATTSGASTGAATGGSGGSSNSTAEDDEVGAFFKAVAMKIRNAKMSPIAFTDLQIDILRVINGTLRNH